MNILFCDDLRVGSLVGWSVHAFEVISRLSQMGHKVVLLNGGSFRNHVETEANLQIPLWRRVEIRLLQWPVFQPFRSERFMLGVFRHEIYVFFSTLIAIARRKQRFDIIYRRHTVLNSEHLLAKLFRIPSVKEVNGIVADETKITKQGDRISLRIIDWIERFNMPRADKIIVVTSELKEVLHNQYKVPQNKIVVIENGANTDLFKPMDVMKVREELALGQNNNYVCFVGAFFPWQGIEYVIRSMPLVLSECPQTHLIIVGDGQMKQELIELAEQIGISNKVIFTGMVPYQKVPLYINVSEVCVAPFRRELNRKGGQCSLKVPEYLACGKPLVVSRLSGLEMLEQNEAGILVEPENPPELATAIIKLLQNQELRKQMGANGRKYVVENQSWESVAKRVAEVCQSLVDSRRRKAKPAKH